MVGRGEPSAMAAGVTARQAALDCDEGQTAEYVYKLAYAGLPVRRRCTSLAGLRQLYEARDYAEFDAALAGPSRSIALNFAFASADGHIGYVLCGEVPLGRGRAGDNTFGGDSWYPLCGWSGEHDYQGWLPHRLLPKALDPPSGLLVSANHRIVDYESYPHWLGLVFKSSYRARAIHAELDAARKPVSLRDMAAAQQSVLSIAAREFAQLVVTADVSRTGLAEAEADRARLALAALDGWDGRLEVHCGKAALYQLMHAELASEMLHLGVAARTRGAVPAALLLPDAKDGCRSVLGAVVHGSGNDHIYKMANELQGHLHNNVLRMLQADREGEGKGEGPLGWWVRQAGGFHTCVAKAAARAQLRLSRRADKSWGSLHQTTIAHPLTAAFALPAGSFLDCPPLAFGGDTNTPAQAANRSLDDLSGNGSHQSVRHE